MTDHQKIATFLSYGICPYFRDRENTVWSMQANELNPAVYEVLINSGFRRNGFYFYRNVCFQCQDCIPIRVNVEQFKPSKSQRRAFRKNQDVIITRQPAAFDETDFQLYRKYCKQRHGAVEYREDYIRFLIESPVPTEMIRYYLEDRLIGIGWIDVLPHSLSSVYFIFDPDCSERSLGVFSVLKEAELCRQLGKQWLQLGFWIEKHPKMSYKNQYKPYHLLIDGTWTGTN